MGAAKTVDLRVRNLQQLHTVFIVKMGRLISRKNHNFIREIPLNEIKNSVNLRNPTIRPFFEFQEKNSISTHKCHQIKSKNGSYLRNLRSNLCSMTTMTGDEGKN